MKYATIEDFLSHGQIKLARELYDECKGVGFAELCCRDIIRPNIAGIDKKLGQPNSPLYLAYAVEYMFTKGSSQVQIYT